MAISNPSCAVAFPRERNNATDNGTATSNATEGRRTASKPTSIKELREQLRAQQERNQSGTQDGELSNELREVLNWLHRIDENDQDIIDCTLEKCRADVDALDYFLGRARE